MTNRYLYIQKYMQWKFKGNAITSNSYYQSSRMKISKRKKINRHIWCVIEVIIKYYGKLSWVTHISLLSDSVGEKKNMLYESLHFLLLKNQFISTVAMLWFHIRRLTFPACSGKYYDVSEIPVWSLLMITFVWPSQIRLKLVHS